MSVANQLETLMLGLINEERAAADLDPLTFNGDLNEASEDHSTWMLDTDTFSHTGEGGSSAGDRIVAAGYKLEGNWTWGENIGWQSERGEPGLADDVRDIHESLMNSPGHRANILSADYEEIGIGIERGDFEGYDSVMITQNFGTTDAVADAPEDTDAPVAEGPAVDDLPEEDVTEADPTGEDVPQEDTPVTEAPEEEAPEDEMPDEDVTEEEDPGEDVTEDDITGDEVTDEEVTDDDGIDEEEPPVAEMPEEDTTDEVDPPVAEAPDTRPFDVDVFLADLNQMLNELFDSFDFAQWDGCGADGMEEDLRLGDPAQTRGGDRFADAEDWLPDEAADMAMPFVHDYDLA